MAKSTLRTTSCLVAFGTLVSVTMSGCGDDALNQLPNEPLTPATVFYPDIFAEPTSHNFGALEVGASGTKIFQIGNSGAAGLDVQSVTLTGAGAAAFAVTQDLVSGQSLAPSSLSTFTVAFTPTSMTAYPAYLEIASNDPDENPLEIELAAEGVVTGGPIAVCTVTPAAIHYPSEAATWIGSASHDPNGYAIVSYAWRLLTKPAGSVVTMPTCTGTADCGPFSPDLNGVYTAELVIENELGLRGSCTVDLPVVWQGAGPTAACAVSPTTLNVGEGTAVWLGHSSFDPDGYVITNYTWRLRSKPATSAAVMTTCNNTPDCGPFTPDVAGIYTGELTVVNQMGNSATCTTKLQVAQVAQGPHAVCSVTPGSVHPPFESATWIGSGSSDPDGHPLTTWVWRLVSQPAGSAVTMPACSNTADCGPFMPDLAGTYVGELTITNSLGLTDTCTASLTAVPLENLWIEMYWTHSGDDMDLHLLAPGGTPRTSSDCYFMNCVGGGPDWGVVGNHADDPALDLDDIPGVGPENINITAPAAGDYKVFVHDYPGSSYTPANSVTVKVYIGGNLVFTDTRSISGEDSDTYFAKIAWPSGVVTRL